MIANSIWFTIGTTILSVGLGTVLAYLSVRTDVPFKRLIFIAAIVPLVVPGILYAVAWLILLSPRVGLYNTFAEPLLGPDYFNAFSIWGMILIEGLHLAPLAFLLMFAAFRSMDPSLEESALMCGARLSTLLRRVTLPLMRPALYAAILIMAVQALEAFEVPALLGIPGNIWVFSTSIWDSLHRTPANYGQAGAYSISLFVLTAVGVFAYSRLNRRAKSFQTVTGKGFRPRPMTLGKLRMPATIFALLYMLIAIGVPGLILLYTSFQTFYTSPSIDSISNSTIANYRQVFTSDFTLRAMKNSAILSIGTATAVMLAMAIVSWLVVRTKIRGRWIVDTLCSLPLAVPGLVLGVAMLFVYLRSPIPIYGTMWILLIAYFTRFMPYGIRWSSVSMYQISRELEESAHMSGATWLQTFRRVVLPLLIPGLIGGWVYVAIMSVRELSASVLLYAPENEVLSIVIWNQWNNGGTTLVSALGVVMITGMAILVVLAYKFSGRWGVQP